MDMRSYSSGWVTNHTIYIDFVFLHKTPKFLQTLCRIDSLHVYDAKGLRCRKALARIWSSAARRQT